MDWIKVTPETLPPDGEAVMVTVMNGLTGNKVVWMPVFWSENLQRWRDEDGFIIESEVTRWALMPAPAEDEDGL